MNKLLECIKQHDTEELQKVLERYAEAKKTNGDKDLDGSEWCNPICLAIDSPDIVKLLLNAGAKPNIEKFPLFRQNHEFDYRNLQLIKHSAVGLALAKLNFKVALLLLEHLARDKSFQGVFNVTLQLAKDLAKRVGKQQDPDVLKINSLKGYEVKCGPSEGKSMGIDAQSNEFALPHASAVQSFINLFIGKVVVVNEQKEQSCQTPTYARRRV